jgi:murein DD-endopeptidase MepM/ murein hydrolase activator NlpD
VLPDDLAAGPFVALDLSESNASLAGVDLADPVAFGRWVDREMAVHEAKVGIGRYAESRVIYRHSELFGGGEPRSVHLGIDLFVPSGTAVRVPLAGRIHSVGYNRARGDYGPTVIVEHEVDGVRFWTLYGHLAETSLTVHDPGDSVSAGATVGWIGAEDVNGGWPPHLHFQLITDIGSEQGDFPGVAAPSVAGDMLALCPDPTPLLGMAVVT